KSRKLGVHGVVDLVVLNGSRAKAVEVKLQTSRRGLWKRLRHHLVQAAAYAIAVEETLRVVVDEAIVIGLEKGGAARVKTTPAVRSYVAAVAEEVRRLAQSETRPRPTAERAKCRACFYRKVCRATLEEPCTRA
ncbi:MAG: CRISPR-associated protein Cas4, partial [Acidilobaceae archaeon]